MSTNPKSVRPSDVILWLNTTAGRSISTGGADGFDISWNPPIFSDTNYELARYKLEYATMNKTQAAGGGYGPYQADSMITIELSDITNDCNAVVHLPDHETLAYKIRLYAVYRTLTTVASVKVGNPSYVNNKLEIRFNAGPHLEEVLSSPSRDVDWNSSLGYPHPGDDRYVINEFGITSTYIDPSGGEYKKMYMKPDAIKVVDNVNAQANGTYYIDYSLTPTRGSYFWNGSVWTTDEGHSILPGMGYNYQSTIYGVNPVVTVDIGYGNNIQSYIRYDTTSGKWLTLYLGRGYMSWGVFGEFETHEDAIKGTWQDTWGSNSGNIRYTAGALPAYKENSSYEGSKGYYTDNYKYIYTPDQPKRQPGPPPTWLYDSTLPGIIWYPSQDVPGTPTGGGLNLYFERRCVPPYGSLSASAAE